MREREPSSSESYFWPSFWAILLHVFIFGALFVSFAFTPELPPSKPIVQATLYQLKSKSPATTQTNQKIAGESKRTAARQTEIDQMEQKKAEQEAVAEAEQKKADAAQKAEQARQADEAKKQAAADAAKAADAKKAADAAKAAEAKKAEDAAIALKKAEDDAKKQAEEDAKKKAAEDAKKQAAEDAKKKAAEDAKKQAADDAKKKAADDAKKQAAADAAKKQQAQDKARKAQEDKKAQALADLLGDKVERQATKADEMGDSVAGDFDDLIRSRTAENWNRPPSARKGMAVRVRINMLPDGTVSRVVVDKSSGDSAFDASAVAAVQNIGRLTEMQGLSPQDFAPYRNFTITFTPEDLAL
ncbi:cell envelope integrity protein TolA [Pseudomonas sp. NPDC007930]|uniref:cell envelope integrity protein TolA n=1 Tax=Pseudomonas sp. NPDC007930 TaxID=3364417 RepID=UPI0036E923F5